MICEITGTSKDAHKREIGIGSGSRSLTQGLQRGMGASQGKSKVLLHPNLYSLLHLPSVSLETVFILKVNQIC